MLWELERWETPTWGGFRVVGMLRSQVRAPQPTHSLGAGDVVAGPAVTMTLPISFAGREQTRVAV